MFALTIDTSTPAVLAGVVRLELSDREAPAVELVSQRAPVSARGHTELLAPAVAECLAEARLTPADIGAVVAGVGPGPYTGLRVGLVTAAAFADAVGAPAWPVCSLDAMAAVVPRGDDVVVITDARRREVFWARYDAQGERVAGPEVAAPADVPLDGVTRVTGYGAELYEDVWPGCSPLPIRHPDALGLAAVAVAGLQAGASPEPLTPLYLRRPDAVEPGRPKPVTR